MTFSKSENKVAVEGLHPAYHQLDVDDEQSIQSFADYIKGNYGGIDILVNNAGIAFKNEANETFYEQASATLRTNYFSLVSLCAILFPLLRPGARVVNLTSSLGHLSCIRAEHLRKTLSNPELTIPKLSAYMNEFVETTKTGDWKLFGWPSNAYSVSKVGVSALSRIQQKQMSNDIVVNAVHPGYCHTDMTSFRGHFPPDRGAEAVVHCALLPPNTSIRGAYMWHDKRNVSWLMYEN